MSPLSQPERSQTVERALDLIDALEQSGPSGLSVAQLAKVLALNKTIVRRLAVSLAERDYIRRTPTGSYTLGLRLIALGRAVSDSLELRQAALPHMRSLSDRVGETVLLTVLDGQDAVCVEKVDQARQILRVAAAVGRRLPMYRGTSAKVLLAFQPTAFIERIIAPLPSPEQLRQQLDQFRRQGWANTVEELDEGIGGIGAPIRNHEGSVVAGLTIVGTVNRVNPIVAPALAPIIMEAADAVSQAMGFQQQLSKGDTG